MKLSFGFGKRFGHDRLTAEQKAVVDRLERGEISAEEAERLLGGDVRTFRIRVGNVPTEDPSPTAETPAETTEEAKARELIERIAREVDAETGG